MNANPVDCFTCENCGAQVESPEFTTDGAPLCPKCIEALELPSFGDIIAAVENAYHADTAPAATDADHFAEIDEHVGALDSNISKDDADAVRLENLACLIAASFRFAKVLMRRTPAEEVAKILIILQ